MTTMVSVAAVLVLCASTPFEDTQGRFSLDLPDGWSFAPQPGHTSGASFKKELDGIPASAAVRIWEPKRRAGLRELTKMLAAASDREPGYELLLDETTKVAGVPAVRRRFVLFIGGDPKWSKVVEQQALVVDQPGGVTRGYVLHAETIAEAFGNFSSDFDAMFASFWPGIKPKATGGVDAGQPSAERVVGKWAGGGHSLQLSPSGVALLDGRHGRYKFGGGVLRLWLWRDGKMRPEEAVRVRFKGESLLLRKGPFGAQGVVFERQKKKAK